MPKTSKMSSLGLIIEQLACLPQLCDTLLCPFCFQPGLKLSKGTKDFGLASPLRISCETCSKVMSSTNTSAKVDKVFEVNRRSVATSLARGNGQAGLATFYEMMDISVTHHKTFLDHQRRIHRACASFSSQVLAEAGGIVRNAYPEQSGQHVIDIDVSYDGSWHTRGHKSMCGIGVVIENRTGHVVDYEVLSKYCQLCSTVGDKLVKDSKEYVDFWNGHEEHCDRNHSGSSGSMEQKAAVRMWSRSVDRPSSGLDAQSMFSSGSGGWRFL